MPGMVLSISQVLDGIVEFSYVTRGDGAASTRRVDVDVFVVFTIQDECKNYAACNG